MANKDRQGQQKMYSRQDDSKSQDKVETVKIVFVTIDNCSDMLSKRFRKGIKIKTRLNSLKIRKNLLALERCSAIIFTM